MTLTLIPPSTPDEATQQLAQLQGTTVALAVLRRVQLVKAAEAGVTQQQLAGALGRAQSSISEYLARARTSLADRPATHPLWPAEVIDLYAAGLLPRDEVLSYLASYPYIDPAPTDDPAYTVTQPGEFGEVAAAHWSGKLSEADYADLYDLLHADDQLNSIGSINFPGQCT